MNDEIMVSDDLFAAHLPLVFVFVRLAPLRRLLVLVLAPRPVLNVVHIHDKRPIFIDNLLGLDCRFDFLREQFLCFFGGSCSLDSLDVNFTRVAIIFFFRLLIAILSFSLVAIFFLLFFSGVITRLLLFFVITGDLFSDQSFTLLDLVQVESHLGRNLAILVILFGISLGFNGSSGSSLRFILLLLHLFVVFIDFSFIVIIVVFIVL